jgi:hypothetical protein
LSNLDSSSDNCFDFVFQVYRARCYQ